MIPVLESSLGARVWYNHTGHGRLAAFISRVNPDGTVNLFVLDDGTNALTDGLGADRKLCVTLRQSYAETCGGECSWPVMSLAS